MNYKVKRQGIQQFAYYLDGKCFMNVVDAIKYLASKGMKRNELQKYLCSLPIRTGLTF